MADSAYRIKRRALEAAVKVSHHVSQNGASNQSYVADVEFKAESQPGPMGPPALTTGIEFKVMDPNGRVQNVRIEGPSWAPSSGEYRGIALCDLGAAEEHQMMAWCEKIEKVAPLFRTMTETEDIFLQGIVNWQNYGIESDLLVMLWAPESEPDNADIPWEDLLPSGLIHVVAPWRAVLGDWAPDPVMTNLRHAVNGVLDRDGAVAWIQFNGDFDRESLLEELGISAPVRPFGPKPPTAKFHYLTCQSVYEFSSQWNTLNREFGPELWVLYNPWLAPDIPPTHPGSTQRASAWQSVLENLLCRGTLVALNRIDPETGPKDHALLKPWRNAEHEQDFMDTLLPLTFSVQGRHDIKVFIPREERFNRNTISAILQATDKDFGVKLLDDGNIEVWHGFTAKVIDLKAWRAQHGD